MATDPLNCKPTAPVQITDVIRHTDPADRVKLEATVILGGVTLRGVRLVSGRGGPFVGLPSHREGDRWIPWVVLSDGLNERVLQALLPLLSEVRP